MICRRAANKIVITTLVMRSVRIGTPTRYCHFLVVVLNVPEILAGIPIEVKSALMITIRMAKLMKMARKSLIIMLRFIRLRLLYFSNQELHQRIVLSKVLIMEIMTEVPMTATYRRM
jgi:hypothetical protein